MHFSRSDTSGEKSYEEFYTDEEAVDMDRLSALGVITDKPIPSRQSIEQLLEKLTFAFDNGNTSKQEIVNIIKDYLPSFEHIEKGRSLDSKM